jgi:hypothetical protein
MGETNAASWNEDGEDNSESSLGVGGNVTPNSGVAIVVAGDGHLTAGISLALAGARIRTPRNSKNTGTASQFSNFSELMQFTLMHAGTKNLMEQRCHKERGDAEDRHRHEREGKEDRNHHECQEAEERCEHWLGKKIAEPVGDDADVHSEHGEGNKRKRDEHNNNNQDDDVNHLNE